MNAYVTIFLCTISAKQVKKLQFLLEEKKNFSKQKAKMSKFEMKINFWRFWELLGET